MRKSRAVSPVIATLLLIAITASSGVVLYVFASGMAGRLSPSGTGQVGERYAIDAYNFPAPYQSASLIVRNVGSAPATISVVYYDGSQCASGGRTCSSAVASSSNIGVQSTSRLTLVVTQAQPGTTHTVKVVMSDGSSLVVQVVAGQSG